MLRRPAAALRRLASVGWAASRRSAEESPWTAALAAFAVGLVVSSVPGGMRLAAVGIGCVAALACFGMRRSAALTSVCLIAGTVFASARVSAIDRSSLRSFEGRFATVTGTVTDQPRQGTGSVRATVDVHGLDVAGSRIGVDEPLFVTASEERGVWLRQVRTGDRITVGGILKLPRAQSAPDGGGEFDQAAWLRLRGIHAILHAETIRLTGERRGGAAGVVDEIRERATRSLEKGLPHDSASLLRGMVLGDDSDVPKSVVEDFRKSGLAHLLAVSGSNVVLLSVLGAAVLAVLGVGLRGRLVGVLGLIALYVPLTGASPPILRAGVMGAAGSVAVLAGRSASRRHAALLAAVVTLAVNPLAWMDVAWELSFAAVIGILFLARPLERRLPEWIPRPLRSVCALTVAATVATAPLMAFRFGSFSLVGVGANVLAAPVVGPVMWLGMVSAACGLMPGNLGALPVDVVNGLNGFALGYLAALAHWTGSLPGAMAEFDISSPVVLLALYAVMMAILWALSRVSLRSVTRLRRGGLVGGSFVAAAVIGVGMTVWALAGGGERLPRRDVEVTFLDVGQGDGTLIRTRSGAVVLVDGGPPGNGLVDEIESMGIEKIDVVAITHAQLDHFGDLGSVVDTHSIGLVLDGGGGAGSLGPGGEYAGLVSAIERRRVKRVVPTAGIAFDVQGLKLEVLSPPASPATPGADPNDRSLVMVAKYGDFEMLLPADAESDILAGLDLPDVDALKVSHHGSADPGLSEVLGRLRPEVAGIEVGKENTYGHPHPGTIAELTKSVPTVVRTDRTGSVTVGWTVGAGFVGEAGGRS